MIILNEKKYAEECLKNKTISEKPFFTLAILAKYYYYCYGYRKKRITELLKEFIQTAYPLYEFDKASWNETIEKIAKNVGNQRLKEQIKSMKAIHDQALKDYMLGLKEATAAKNAMNELLEEAKNSKARYEALMRDLINAR